MIAQFAPTDIGPPHYWDKMPEMCQKNYGKWQYHEYEKIGVMKHVGPEGALYTVRVGSPRLLSTVTLRWFADLADQYCDGHLRFTSRHNVEFLLVNPDNIDPLINVLEEAGWPVGGTGKSLKNLIHTQGWVHCHSSATDSSSP